MTILTLPHLKKLVTLCKERHRKKNPLSKFPPSNWVMLICQKKWACDMKTNISNPTLKFAPFGRWDAPSARPLAIRYAPFQPENP